jgi:hypothetical protein
LALKVRRHFATLSQDKDCPARLDVLLDLSEMTTLPESDQLRTVTSDIAHLRPQIRFGSCAIVASTPPVFGMARMFEVFAEPYFSATRVFRTEAEAADWLEAERSRARADCIAGFPDTPIGKLGRTLIGSSIGATARPAPTSCPATYRTRLSRRLQLPIASPGWPASPKRAAVDTLLAPHARGDWYGYGFTVREVGGKQLRGHGGGGPGSGISSELGWFLDGSYTAIVLGNYDLPGASAIYQKLIGFLALQ